MTNREISARLSNILKTNGLKRTVQRDAVATALLRRDCHKTAQEVYAELKGKYPSLSQNTVYLTLQQFEELGLIKRVSIGGKTFFDSNVLIHDHAFCQQCGLLVDVSISLGQQTPLILGQWRIAGAEHTWLGVCPGCAEGHTKKVSRR